MGTEGIQDKYINPYTDFGFKLLFGTAMNKELFEAAEIAKFNPKELGEYWESLKNFRDWYSVMSTQLKKGREEGLKEGLEQGRKEECFPKMSGLVRHHWLWLPGRRSPLMNE